MTQDYPTGSDPVGTALAWVEALVLGSFGTSIAILAVAGIGFSLMTGRLSLRRGTAVIIGCAILFGAPVIATALLWRPGSITMVQPPGTEVLSRDAPESRPLPANAGPYDPYAGASVPVR